MGDITKYKDKIDPGKEYEIVGQDILNVINTIDSLKNEMDSLTKHNNSVDTLYDTVYVNQTKEVKFENYTFYIIFGLVLCFAAWLHKFKLMD